MCPVEVVGVPRVRVLATEHHAVYEAAHERDESEYKEDYTQDPGRK